MAIAQLQSEVTKINNFQLTIVKNASLSLRIQFGNFNMNFAENFTKKTFLGRMLFLRRISKVLLKFYHVTIFKDLATLKGTLMQIRKSPYMFVFI